MAIRTNNKPKPTPKKRSAAHHRRSKQYHQPYLPFLPVLFMLAVGVLLNIGWTSGAVLGAKTRLDTSGLTTATNGARAEASLTPLQLHPKLSKAAQNKAEDMAARNYWAHETPDGSSPWTFITGAGYAYTLAGENLAYGFKDADTTIKGWLNSKEHRENLLNTGYTEVGFGLASAANFRGKGPTTIVVALYAKPSTDTAAQFTFTVPERPVAVKGNHDSVPSQNVSRIQLLSGTASPWVVVLVSALSGGAIVLFLVRYGLKIRRLINRGEAFVAHHPLFDLAVVGIAVIGFVLTRVEGAIR